MPNALLDSSTHILLALSDDPALISFLAECTRDTTHASRVHQPNYAESDFLTTLNGTDYPQWTWQAHGRRFVATHPELVGDAVRRRSALALRKLELITGIIGILERIRRKVSIGIEQQEAIYLAKKMQAQAFKDAGYDDRRAREFPYVTQYADYQEIGLAQAADEILLKAKMHDEYLAKTETIRLKYFGIVRKAAAVDELHEVYKSCYDECFYNTRV